MQNYTLFLSFSKTENERKTINEMRKRERKKKRNSKATHDNELNSKFIIREKKTCESEFKGDNPFGQCQKRAKNIKRRVVKGRERERERERERINRKLCF